MQMSTLRKRRNQGSIVLHFVLFLTVMFIMLAFAVDIGWMYVTKAQLQHAADAAALASVVELGKDSPDVEGKVAQYTSYHEAGDSASLSVISEDITQGYMYDPTQLQSEINTGSTQPKNSVEVTLKRTSDVNGALKMFMGFVTGINEMDVQAKARATYETRVFGFSAPPGEINEKGIPVGTIIPFAVSKDIWTGVTTDAFSCTPNDLHGTGTYSVSSLAGDGQPEIKLYPDKNKNTPGNFGTVDIGESNNSANDLRRQIESGINAADMAAMGIIVAGGTEYSGIFLSALDDETIILTSDNEPNLFNGDTGISVGGIQSPMEDQIGVPRVFLLYETVSGNGNNAQYKIVGWEIGIICEVHLTGNDKHIIVQKGSQGSSGTNVSGTGIFLPSAPTSGSLWMYALTR